MAIGASISFSVGGEFDLLLGNLHLLEDRLQQATAVDFYASGTSAARAVSVRCSTRLERVAAVLDATVLGATPEVYPTTLLSGLSIREIPDFCIRDFPDMRIREIPDIHVRDFPEPSEDSSRSARWVWAHTRASWRECTPSLARMRVTWHSTVLSVIHSVLAMLLLSNPCAIRRNTSRSRSVSRFQRAPTSRCQQKARGRGITA